MNRVLQLLLVLSISVRLASAEDSALSNDHEKQFTAMLNNVTLTGRWCLVRDGQLTPERDDAYSIVGVQKGEGDKWTVNARVKQPQATVVVPIPVRVQWAGGAAVMIVDNLTMPGGGTYSARVLFHNNTYSGTWRGGDRTGLLHGIITASAEKAPTSSKADGQ